MERVIAMRPPLPPLRKTNEYLVKWKNLPYSKASWLPVSEFDANAQTKIDEYMEHESRVEEHLSAPKDIPVTKRQVFISSTYFTVIFSPTLD